MSPGFTYHKSMFRTGLLFLAISIILLLLIPNNNQVVLGINSLLKPLKFALSIWIYFWTMALLLPLLENKALVRRFSVFAIFTMLYDQLFITVQAFRGELSHFNYNSMFELILYGLMGLLITTLTFYTLYLAFKFKNQKNNIHPAFKIAVFWGFIIFVSGSLIGGLMSVINSHNVGGNMGEGGIWLTDWSYRFGDLRVAHFLGIHALQIIPLSGLFLSKQIKSLKVSSNLVSVVIILYTIIFSFLFIQALLGKPLISLTSL